MRIEARYRQIPPDESLDYSPSILRAIPDGHKLGKPFVICTTGRIFDRYSGEQRGLDIDDGDIDDALAVWSSGEEVFIDLEHDEARPIGRLVGLYKASRGGKACLVAVPAYSAAGVDYVASCAGNLWSSPHLQWTELHDAETGDRLGGFRVKALALTVDPAQSHRVLTAVRLSTDATDASPIPTEQVTSQEYGMDPEEMKALLDTIMSRLDALEKGLSALQEGKASEDEGEGEMSEDGGEKASDEAMASEALSAENRALRERVRKLEEGQRLSEREKRIGACLSSGRMTPAERKTAEKAYDRDPGLFAEIYEARLSGSMVPTLKGHGNVPEVKLSSEPRAERAEQIQATNKLGYVAALTKAAGEV